jgi:hypothetical protein
VEYRFVNSKTGEIALNDDGSFLSRGVEHRSSSEWWGNVLYDVCTSYGWELEDTLAVSRDGLFAYWRFESIEIKSDFFGQIQYQSKLWIDV